MRPSGVTWALIAILGGVAARRWLDIVEVRGRSMAPTLLPGDRLLVARLPPRPGDVVLAADPRAPGRELVKRVARLDGGAIGLRGDNLSASTDGRAFGAVPSAAVEWRAICRYWPLDRIGLIPGAPKALEPIDEGGEPACAMPEALIAGHELSRRA